MASQSVGMSLYEAARGMGVSFAQEYQPTDKTVRANNLNFHYLEWGNPANPKILMLHGVSQQAHSWDFVALALSDRFNVLALDQRGHGDSDWAPDGDYSLEAQQSDIDAVVDALGLNGFTLMGHSMGGRNSYVWASRHPKVLDALVIVDTGPQGQRAGRERIQRFQQLPDELDSFEEFADRVQEYTGRQREQVVGALKYSIRERPDGKWSWKYDKVLRTPGARAPGWESDRLWECVKKIDCPTLVVRGERSDIFADETLNRMRDEIPDCSIATIARAGHLVQGDNPADFLAEAEKLLARVYSSAA